MAFYEVLREDESGYASAVVRAHGSRQALTSVKHLGYTADNAVVVRIPDGRDEENRILAHVEEWSPEANATGE